MWFACILSLTVTQLVAEPDGWDLKNAIQLERNVGNQRAVDDMVRKAEKSRGSASQYRDDVGQKSFEKAATDLFAIPTTFRVPLGESTKQQNKMRGSSNVDNILRLVPKIDIKGWQLTTNICIDSKDGTVTKYGARPSSKPHDNIAFRYSASRFPIERQHARIAIFAGWECNGNPFHVWSEQLVPLFQLVHELEMLSSKTPFADLIFMTTEEGSVTNKCVSHKFWPLLRTLPFDPAFKATDSSELQGRCYSHSYVFDRTAMETHTHPLMPNYLSDRLGVDCKRKGSKNSESSNLLIVQRISNRHIVNVPALLGVAKRTVKVSNATVISFEGMPLVEQFWWAHCHADILVAIQGAALQWGQLMVGSRDSHPGAVGAIIEIGWKG
jgi:hypothetical protein